MKRKNAIRRIATLVLCMIIALTASNLQTASAATKKIPLKVTFNGKNGKKTVTIVKDLNKDRDGNKIKTLISKWGKPTDVEDLGVMYYTWKKGKTEIKVNDGPGEGYVYGISIAIGDKNGSMFGVKVGMKKNKAIKKLEKALNVKTTVEDSNSWNSFDELITANAPNESENFTLGIKNGKVAYIICTNPKY